MSMYEVHIDERVKVEAGSPSEAVERARWLISDDIQAGLRNPEVMTLEAQRRLYFAKQVQVQPQEGA